ncbi:unnamed protein product [Closterium sp. Naga37s-1]|nr:unnamed protein product [Closterium sp. Naga37s-1]
MPSHGPIMPSHGPIMPSHGPIMPSHGPIMPSHGPIMPSHGPIMPSHGPIMPSHGPIMPSHGPIMPSHGPIMPSHGPIMPSHGPIMPSHGPIMPSHGPIMPSHGPIMPSHGPIMPSHGPISPHPPGPNDRRGGGCRLCFSLCRAGGGGLCVGGRSRSMPMGGAHSTALVQQLMRVKPCSLPFHLICNSLCSAGRGLRVGRQLPTRAGWGRALHSTALVQELMRVHNAGGAATQPVIEDSTSSRGLCVGGSSRSMPVGGAHSTALVQQLMWDRGEPVPAEEAIEVARKVKETYGYTCSDLVKEFTKHDREPYKYRKVWTATSVRTNTPYHRDVGHERFLAAEVFFSPEIAVSNVGTSLAELVDAAVQTAAIDTRRSLYKVRVVWVCDPRGASSALTGVAVPSLSPACADRCHRHTPLVLQEHRFSPFPFSPFPSSPFSFSPFPLRHVHPLQGLWAAVIASSHPCRTRVIPVPPCIPQNIVLSGGSTLFKDFGRRLQRDVKKALEARMAGSSERDVKGAVEAWMPGSASIEPNASDIEVTVVCHHLQEHAVRFGQQLTYQPFLSSIPLMPRHFPPHSVQPKASDVEVAVVSHHLQEPAVWFGGSVVASSPGFQGVCTTRAAYLEHGPSHGRMQNAKGSRLSPYGDLSYPNCQILRPFPFSLSLVAHSSSLAKEIYFVQNAEGSGLSPFGGLYLPLSPSLPCLLSVQPPPLPPS